ncbi:transposase [Streptomyces antibioticus]
MRDLPERFGPWKTVYERHQLWSADGTCEHSPQELGFGSGMTCRHRLAE